MLLQSPLVKEKSLCLPAPESDTVICEKFRSAVFIAESFTTDLKTRPKLREDIAFSNISAVNLSVGSPTLHMVSPY